MSESHTIKELLDYMEANSSHDPVPSDCDCGHCSTYAAVINISQRMGEGAA